MPMASLLPVAALAGDGVQSRPRGDEAVTETPHPSISALHKQWAKLEEEQPERGIAIERAGVAGDALASARERQARLLLEINSVVAAIRDAPATTLEDFIALLDVALEHELDLAWDIAFYGRTDYPMTARLLRVLAHKVPGFEFNSLRRWLSSPGQLQQLMGEAAVFDPAGNDRPLGMIRFGG